jgi:hypothetical protein
MRKGHKSFLIHHAVRRQNLIFGLMGLTIFKCSEILYFFGHQGSRRKQFIMLLKGSQSRFIYQRLRKPYIY